MATPTTEEKLVKRGQLYEVGEDGVWNFFFDASTLKAFIECEDYFFLTFVKSYRGKGRKIKTDLGSWWSKTMELYYNAFRAGDLTNEKVVDFALHAWNECKMDELAVNFPKSFADFGGRKGAVLMACQYFDNYIDVDNRTWKVISVEEGAGRMRELRIGEDDKVRVYFIVKPDLFVLENDRYFQPVDHKTKDYIHSDLIHSFKPHLQLMGYIIAGQQLATQLGLDVTVDRCTINVAARNEPGPRSKNQQRFQRIHVSYSQSQLHEWRLRIMQAARRMRYCFETNFWQWNTESCHKFGGCVFRHVHSQPPEVRERLLTENFVKIAPWNPYKTEQEEENGE